MAILEGCSLWYTRCSPKHPNKKFNPENPTWEVQIRTTDKAKKKIWEENGIRVKAVLPDDGAPYYTANIKRKQFKKTGEENTPPPVVDGGLNPIPDPNTIANGSIGNVQIYEFKYFKDGEQRSSITLMQIQVTTWLKGPGMKREDFKPTETEIIATAAESELPAEGSSDEGSDSEFDDGDF